MSHLNPRRESNLFPQKAEVVVIGGGVIGTSILYYLAKNKIDVILLEKKTITYIIFKAITKYMA